MKPAARSHPRARRKRLLVTCVSGWPAVQHRKVGAPWPHGVAVLFSHHTSDLSNVSEIVYDPCRQQLSERDRPEPRMLALQPELFVGKLPSRKCSQVGRSQV